MVGLFIAQHPSLYNKKHNSSIYTTLGTYNFDSTPNSVLPDVVNLSITVNEGQIGLRTFIDWNQNIFDVLTVWDVTTTGDTTYLTATDMDYDGIRGFNYGIRAVCRTECDYRCNYCDTNSRRCLAV